MAITEPLGRAVVYDSFVQGSWTKIATASRAPPRASGERPWVTAYVAQRRNWLATNPRADLRDTVYRMDALGRLIELGAWGLELPLVVRGSEVSATTLAGTPAGSYDGPQPGTRPLAFDTAAPLCRGLDVRLVQLALSERGADIRADGVFGRASANCIADHQRSTGLPVTGVADASVVRSLADEIAG